MAVSERLLLILALAHVVAGVLLAALPFVPSIHSSLVAAVFGQGKATREVLFLVAVFGPTVASWGVLFFALVRSFFRDPTVGSWLALVFSVLVWAALDSALCIHYGLYSVVALNIAVAGALLGLLFTVRGLAYARREDKGKEDKGARLN